jgi:23S rRNA (guanosine2251-2'-O)-methyltransferase
VHILEIDMKGENYEKIYGRHPVHEALIAGRRRIRRITIAEGIGQTGIIEQIRQKAETAQIPLDFVPREVLEQEIDHHQGVVAEASPYPYVTLQELLHRLETCAEPGLVLLLDVLQDPQNVGTLLRTAEGVGVHGIVLPRRRGAGITPAVVRSSAGASEHLWITQGNLARIIKELKTQGFWIVGLDMDPIARPWGHVDLTGPIGLVVGGEGKGLRRLVRESCDFLMRLPMKGKLESLNAAVAGSIALYAIWQARGFSNDFTEGRD